MFTASDGRLQPIWSFFLAVAFSVAAYLICGDVAYTLEGEHTLRFELVFRTMLALLLFGLYFWLLTVADQVESNQISSLGLPVRVGWLRQFFGGCLFGVAMTVLAVVPVFLWADISLRVRSDLRTLPRVLVVLLVLLLGSLAEELMFRGYPFQRLAEAIGPLAAIAVFSVLFGSVHLLNPGASVWGVINTVAIGVLLSIAYLRTRALWLPWGIHLGWNMALGLLFGLPVSGLRIFNVVVRSTATGPKWLTGGSYGVEAGITGATAVVAGLFVIWRWPLRRLGASLAHPVLLCEANEPEHPPRLPGIRN